jgi:4-amino-4-deoxychorismate lyase
MSLLLESLRIRNRQIELPEEHNRRMNRSRRIVFGATDEWDVRALIRIPAYLTDDVYKCRFLYDTAVHTVEFAPYRKRTIRSLKLVDVPSGFEYGHKYADRTELDRVYAQRGRCDEVVIVRDGLLTDTSFSNIALFDGEKWYTPARPLLHGVRRTSLLAQGFLYEADIHVRELVYFRRILLLNALLGPEDAVEIAVENIVA